MRKVRITNKLDAAPKKVFEALQNLSVIEEVMAPLLRLRPIDPEELPERWEVGAEYLWEPYLFNVIPLGEHRTRVAEMDFKKLEGLSEESGKVAKVWNHHITIDKDDDGKAIYTDEAEIEAGILTPIVWLFAYMLYSHRGRRWKRIARRL